MTLLLRKQIAWINSGITIRKAHIDTILIPCYNDSMKTKKQNKKEEQQLMVDILKGDLIYDMGKTISNQMAFIDRIRSDNRSQLGQEKKITEAYLHQEENKLKTMTKFIDDAITEATGERYDSRYGESGLLDYSIKLVLTPRK